MPHYIHSVGLSLLWLTVLMACLVCEDRFALPLLTAALVASCLWLWGLARRQSLICAPNLVLALFAIVGSKLYSWYAVPRPENPFYALAGLDARATAETGSAFAIMIAASCSTFYLAQASGRGGRHYQMEPVLAVAASVQNVRLATDTSSSLRWGAVVAPSFTVASLTLGRGLSQLLSREYYLEDPSSKPLLILGMLTLPIALGGLVYGRVRGTRASLVLTVLLGLSAFSAASRLLVPVALLMAIPLVRRVRRLSAVVLLILASAGALNMALWLRDTHGPHGIVPYASRVLDAPADSLLGRQRDLAGNLLLGFPLTYTTVGRLDQWAPDAVATSLDPLPGSKKYESIESRLALAHYDGAATFPLNGIGTVWAAGAAWLVSVGVLLGLIDAASASAIRRRFGWQSASAGMLAMGVIQTYSLTQYPLRQTFRLYELLCLAALCSAGARFAQTTGARARRPAVRFDRC
jgi:hypothetical protein